MLQRTANEAAMSLLEPTLSKISALLYLREAYTVTLLGIFVSGNGSKLLTFAPIH
jgi:hypothetical protein